MEKLLENDSAETKFRMKNTARWSTSTNYVIIRLQTKSFKKSKFDSLDMMCERRDYVTNLECAGRCR